VIGRDCRRVEARKLQTAVAVGGAHHGDFDALVMQSGDAARPIAPDGHAAFEGQAKFGEELHCRIEVLNHDADVVHTFDRHDVSLASISELTAVVGFITVAC
jgi:hypothetical protein